VDTHSGRTYKIAERTAVKIPWTPEFNRFIERGLEIGGSPLAVTSALVMPQKITLDTELIDEMCLESEKSSQRMRRSLETGVAHRASRSRNLTDAASTASRRSMCGEWPQASRSSASIVPDTPALIASTCFTVPYSSSPP
jgi:hypothetical protein